LEEIGLARDEVYVTNAVKHFRWEPRGNRRLHKKPSARQIEACKPWLHAEILVTKPEIIVCMGATAAQVMMGASFRITKHRGRFFKSEDAAWLMATYHPSAILRAPDKEDRDRKRAQFVEDLKRDRNVFAHTLLRHTRVKSQPSPPLVIGPVSTPSKRRDLAPLLLALLAEQLSCN
jgi:DNA polymerase